MNPTPYRDPILKSMARFSSFAQSACLTLISSSALDGLIREDGLSFATRVDAVLGANINMVDIRVEPVRTWGIVEANFGLSVGPTQSSIMTARD
jgi:hypothetical protein